MTIEIETPDGIVEFPDDMTPDQITAVLRKQYPPAQMQSVDLYSTNPTEGMSGAQKFLAGAGKAMTDVGRGAAQLFGADNQTAIDESKIRDAALMDTGAGVAGNLAGGVASFLPAAMIPGVNTYAGAALVGSGVGALTPTATDESRLGNMAMGAAGGVAGQGIANGISNVLAPKIRQSVTQLMDSGVIPTPGKILGGVPERIEAAAESIPFVGQGIRNAKSRAAKQFNEATINEALSPIGGKVSEIGHEGMRQARSLTEKAYDDALAALPRVDIDPEFDYAFYNVKNMGSSLVPDRQRQLDQILQEQVLDKITPAGTMSGETFKTMESNLKSRAREFLKSQDFDQRQVGSALNAVVGELRNLAGRNSPQAADLLKKADSAYARLLRVERAAAAQGAPDGVFSPAQFGNAVRSMDGSLRRGAVARGEALMQDTATAGREILGDQLPNSGTADRLLNAMMLGGGYAIDPTLAMGAVGLRGLYTDPVQEVIATLLTRRPEAVRTAGDLVRRAAPVGALTGIQGLLNE